jgi:hypothetical protein
MNAASEPAPGLQKPKWVWLPTGESIERDIPSFIAIVETAVATLLLLAATIWFQTPAFLLICFGMAWLVLMPSDESAALSAKWFTAWEGTWKGMWEAGRRWPDLSRGEQMFASAACLAGVAAATVAACVLAACLAGARTIAAFPGGFGVIALAAALSAAVAGLGPAPLAVAIAVAAAVATAIAAVGIIAGAVALTGAVAAAGVIAAALAVLATRKVRPRIVYFAPGAALGAGVFMAAVSIHAAATLRHFSRGLHSVPRNCRRQALCASVFQPQELIPGLPATSRFTSANLAAKVRTSDSAFQLPFLGLLKILHFAYGRLSRAAFKATAWIWLPLAFVAASPKQAATPEWQYKAIWESAIGWIFIFIGLCTFTNAFGSIVALVSRMRCGRHNPLITPLGCLIEQDWPSLFLPVFSVLGPGLAILTAGALHIAWRQLQVAKEELKNLREEREDRRRRQPVVVRARHWFNRTVLRSRTADDRGEMERQYERLKGDALFTFAVIERFQRFQRILAVVYCLLIAGQAALYFNSRKCWVSVPAGVQTWSDHLFGEKSPKRCRR